MRRFSLGCVGFVLAVTLGGAVPAEAQIVQENFDSYDSGAPLPLPWFCWGSSGTTLASDSVYAGGFGKSLEVVRTAFDGSSFGAARHFTSLVGEVELTFHVYPGWAAYEILSAFGRNTANDKIAWWVTIGGGLMEDRIGTYSDSQGWIEVLGLGLDTWYGVHLLIDMDTATYDITVWEDGNPANSNTVTGIDFRHGLAAGTIDELQFGNFNPELTVFSDYAYVDDLYLIGPTIFIDGFNTGTVNAWSDVNP